MTRAMGYNQLYLDLVAGKPEAKRLYPAGSMRDVADRLARISFPRNALAKILERQNKIFKSKPTTFANIQSLRQNTTVVAAAGQQAVLFGGPLMILYKAIWLAKSARRLSADLGAPVIPVFTIAADDHDFEEINHVHLFDVLGEPTAQRYHSNDYPGLPAFQQKFTNEATFAELQVSLKESLGRTDFTAETLMRLFDAYRPGADFVTSFGRYLADILPDLGVVFFSPGDDEFKQLASPAISEIVERHVELKETLRQSNGAITSSGYNLQVQKDEESCHIFALTPERTPIKRVGAEFQVGAERMTISSLQEAVAIKAQYFSPDVLTRPIVAARIFPTLMQGGGAAEVAYFAQLAPLYEVFDRPAPIFAGRAGATLVEKRFEKLLSRHHLTPADFWGDNEHVISATLEKSFPDDLATRFAKLRSDYQSLFDSLAGRVTEFDKSLVGNAEQVWGKIFHALEIFETKTLAAHKKKLADERASLYRAANAFFPRRNLQERVISPLYYFSRYGYRVIDFIVDRLRDDTSDQQILYLSDMENE